MKRLPKLLFFVFYLIACVGLVWGYWALAYRDALTQLTKTGNVHLEQATERFLAQLDRYRQLPGLLADHPLVLQALEADPELELINDFLLRKADISGALDIYIMNANAVTVASSNANMARSFMGHNYAFRPYYQHAINGELAFFHALGSSSGQRGFFFAGPIRNDLSKPIGVVAVKVDLEALEVDWRADPHTVLFYDDNGVVFLANRAGLIFQMYGFAVADLESLNVQRQYPIAGLSPLPDHQEVSQFGHTLWHTSQNSSFPSVSLALTRPVPLVNMTAQVFVSVQDAQEQARFQGILAASMLALISLALYALGQRRRRLAERLVIEERANSTLEAQVERRTQQLRLAQDGLVQAGKMTALGEMSAGLSHELNQPLAAIQNFAENGKILLERERGPEVAQNLEQISGLTKRMDRIIRNLRAFARKEDEQITRVDVSQVIIEAVKLTEIRARNENVTVYLPDDLAPKWVMGGRVRLEQVLVNLISNAMDAMVKGRKCIEITLDADAHITTVYVRDNGPGLNTPDKIFEPFYTTKSVDSGHGLGLGLSISYGIVQSFGGEIKGANHEGGGAVFIMELQTAAETK